MSEQMEFPITFEKFAKEYGFKDDKEVYTNGSDLIPIFRVKQWIEQDNRLRTIEMDTAYECGKHANKWIPVSERLPEDGETILFSTKTDRVFEGRYFNDNTDCQWYAFRDETFAWNKVVTAWMPLPEPYKS